MFVSFETYTIFNNIYAPFYTIAVDHVIKEIRKHWHNDYSNMLWINSLAKEIECGYKVYVYIRWKEQ